MATVLKGFVADSSSSTRLPGCRATLRPLAVHFKVPSLSFPSLPVCRSRDLATPGNCLSWCVCSTLLSPVGPPQTTSYFLDPTLSCPPSQKPKSRLSCLQYSLGTHECLDIAALVMCALQLLVSFQLWTLFRFGVCFHKVPANLVSHPCPIFALVLVMLKGGSVLPSPLLKLPCPLELGPCDPFLESNIQAGHNLFLLSCLCAPCSLNALHLSA